MQTQCWLCTYTCTLLYYCHTLHYTILGLPSRYTIQAVVVMIKWYMVIMSGWYMGGG